MACYNRYSLLGDFAMNMWIVVIIMVPVLALLFFGSNPIKDFQDRSREFFGKYGSDELTIQTNMYLEKQQQGAYSFGGGSVLETPKEGDIMKSIKQAAPTLDDNGNTATSREAMEKARKMGIFDDAQAEALATGGIAPADDNWSGGAGGGKGRLVIRDNQAGTEVSPRSGYSRQTSSQPYGSPSDQYRYSGESYYNNYPAGVASGNLQEEDSYYPPIVKEDPAAFASYRQPVVLTGLETKLRSGHPIVFEGASVYTVDASGNKKDLPDGDYTLENGSKITVKGGIRILN